nr:hypothetical protein [Parapedobacter pyrenivorans]
MAPVPSTARVRNGTAIPADDDFGEGHLDEVVALLAVEVSHVQHVIQWVGEKLQVLCGFKVAALRNLAQRLPVEVVFATRKDGDENDERQYFDYFFHFFVFSEVKK